MKTRIVLKPGKEKPVLARHPWLFSGAIARVEEASDGDTVDIFTSADRWLARGYYNSRSQIAARVWTWDDEPIDRAFLRARLERAFGERRTATAGGTTNAYRLVNAESDLLPGLIVDRYADFVVIQFLTLGVEKRKEEIVELVAELAQPCGILERSDVDVREKEGLAVSVGVVFGSPPPDRLEILENGLRFWVDVMHGHKTGFYLDQRENRVRVARYVADHAHDHTAGSGETLNVFSYTGAFGVHLCGASSSERVINLDTSREALLLAQENMALNDLPSSADFVEGDAFHVLRRYRDEGRSFDAIVLDPPKFVHSQSQLQAGLRGYKDINLLSFKLLKRNGVLVTFSCSGQLSADLFQKVVFGAALDAGREAQIVARLTQASDHPVLLTFPESEYLKGLICQLVD